MQTTVYETTVTQLCTFHHPVLFRLLSYPCPLVVKRGTFQDRSSQSDPTCQQEVTRTKTDVTLGRGEDRTLQVSAAPGGGGEDSIFLSHDLRNPDVDVGNRVNCVVYDVLHLANYHCNKNNNKTLVQRSHR